MDKETVMFCVEKVSRLAKHAADLSTNAQSPTDRAIALIRKDVLLEIEKILLKSVNGSDYCGSCGQWANGPLVCCANDGLLPGISELEAFVVRENRTRTGKSILTGPQGLGAETWTLRHGEAGTLTGK